MHPQAPTTERTPAATVPSAGTPTTLSSSPDTKALLFKSLGQPEYSCCTEYTTHPILKKCDMKNLSLDMQRDSDISNLADKTALKSKSRFQLMIKETELPQQDL